MPIDYNGERHTADWKNFVESETRTGKTAREVFVANQSTDPVPVSLVQKKSPSIQKITIPTKQVETSFVFPAATKSFMIRDRGNSRMRYSYQSGQVTNDAAGLFLDFGPYAIYKEDFLSVSTTLTLYFASAKDARTIEILYWN